MNSDIIHLIQDIDQLPDSLINPVADFVEFLLWKKSWL